MYTIYSHPQATSSLGPWSDHLSAYSDVVGHTAFGHLLLKRAAADTFAVFYPMKSAVKEYHGHKDVEEFRSAVLTDQGFTELVLRPRDLESLEQRLGALGASQIYYPVPYPFVGGSGELSTYDKGDLDVFIHIVGQMLGHSSIPQKAKSRWQFWRRT